MNNLLSLDLSSSHVWAERGEKVTLTPSVRLLGSIPVPLVPVKLATTSSRFASGSALLASLVPGSTEFSEGQSGKDIEFSPPDAGVFEFVAQADPDLKSGLVKLLALGPTVFDFTITNGPAGYCWMGLYGPGPGGETMYWLIDPWPYIAFFEVGKEYTLSASYPVFQSNLVAALGVATRVIFWFWHSPWRNYTDMSNSAGVGGVDLARGQVKPGMRYTIDVQGKSISVVPKTGGAGLGSPLASLGVRARLAMPAPLRPLLGEPLLSAVKVARTLPPFLALPGTFLTTEQGLALEPKLVVEGSRLSYFP